MPKIQTILALLVASLSSGALALVTFHAALHIYDHVRDRWRAAKWDSLSYHAEQQKIELDSIRVLPPDQFGRVGIAVKNGIYRNLDTGRTFTQELNLFFDPVMEQLDMQLKLLQALASGNGASNQIAQIGEMTQTVHQWPTKIPLSGLLGHEQPSLHRLVLGVTLNETTGQHDVVTGDLAKLVHVAIGGSSGWGKSMFLQALAWQLATSIERPDMALIDLEAVTFAPFAKSGRLLYPIADTEQDALAIFTAITHELDRRKDLFKAHPGVDSLTAYNAQADEHLPALVCLVDEATALLSDKGVESALRTLALRGRKYGLWCILGGQDWKASSLDTSIRNQLAARVQFKTMSASQSRVLLEQKGAEDLDTPGRAIAILPGRSLLKFQAPWIPYNNIMDTLKNGGPRHPTPAIDDQDQETDHDQKEYIIDLWATGLSYSEVARRIFGYSGGAAFNKVKAIIQNWEAESL